jgi:hypothetical protein
MMDLITLALTKDSGKKIKRPESSLEESMCEHLAQFWSQLVGTLGLGVLPLHCYRAMLKARVLTSRLFGATGGHLSATATL